ncbi:hypothetical protein BDB00DRAFT_437969 [Zychaea mexicana]|uniref:uncharacterized protein n=1 Tax=Zychaea mexicana TaxID=64656 RepID=UPI0022FE696B|nr:uncharacterized protein BDB00DRAFT_437969 [Zychaea mexicana]KAI9492393.1 hypothetical protein BDB00DRAFT_437969 [Zychaea mexicana]
MDETLEETEHERIERITAEAVASIKSFTESQDGSKENDNQTPSSTTAATATASTSTTTSTSTPAVSVAFSEPTQQQHSPLTTTSAAAVAAATAAANSISTHDLANLNMTPAQLQQVTAAQAQALAQTAAAAMAATSTASSSATPTTAAISAETTNNNGQQHLFALNTSSTPIASHSTPANGGSSDAQPMTGVVLNDGNSIPSVSQLTAEMLKRELINQKVRSMTVDMRKEEGCSRKS